MRSAMIRFKTIALAVGAVLATAPVLAQSSFSASSLGADIVSTVTVGNMVSTISDAISSAVGDVINARPVIDRERVRVITSIVLGRAPTSSRIRARAVGGDDKTGERGDRVVTGLADGTLGLWDMGSGRELVRLTGAHDGAINAVALSEASGIIVSIGANGASQVWSLGSGKRLARFAPGTGGAALGIVLSADGKLAITTYADGTINLWKTDSADQVSAFKASSSAIKAVALRSNDSLVVVGSADGKISIWDAASGKQTLSFEAHKGATTAIVGLANEGRFASTGEDGRVRIWDVETGGEVLGFSASTAPQRAAARDAAGKRLATGGDDGVVHLFDIETGREIRTFEGHGEAISVVAFGKDDAVIHTASLDGTSRIFDVDAGEELVRIVSTENGWAAFNPTDGSFSGERDGESAVKWATDEVAIDMEQFSSSHFEPSLVSRAAAGAKPPVRPGRPQLSVKFGMPPAVAFETPEEDTETDDEDFDVRVQAGDLGGGIIEVRLYQNGRLVAREKMEDEERDADEAVIGIDFEVRLLAGKNKFRVVGLSRDSIESRPAKVKVKYTGGEHRRTLALATIAKGEGEVASQLAAQSRSTLHLVTVGINTYGNPAFNLNYGAPDAKGIGAAFNGPPLKLFKAVKVHSLLDKDATRSAIRDVMEGLKESRPEDVIIIYLAGHGDTIDGDWYFMPTEITRPEEADHVRDKAIGAEELDEWINEAPAQKIAMLIDACKSGAALTKTRGFEDRKNLSRLARTYGIHVMAAAAKGQFALELEELGHGAFTYTLLEGLDGKADLSGDGIISVRELMGYVEGRLPGLSEEKSGESQFPVIDSKGQDFPISLRS